MAESVQLPEQEPDWIYALDIGTRSVVGLVGRREQDRVRVLAMEEQPHARRAMLDGQIEDIGQVAAAVTSVTERLERRLRRRLTRACVAAAGRALRTEWGRSVIERDVPETVGPERIRQLELAAVGDAEAALQNDGPETGRMFLTGYAVTRFQLDGYPLASLEGHTGRVLEAEVVATFLPGGVVDSLGAVLQRAGWRLPA